MGEPKEWLGENGILAKRLSDTIKERGLTQKYVAQYVGSKEQTISQYTHGKVLPNAEMIYQLANALDVSADYLLGLSDIRSLDPTNKAMSEILGLSEIAIKHLRAIMEEAYSISEAVSACQALKDARKLGEPTANEVVNLLLEDDYEAETQGKDMYASVLAAISRVLDFKQEKTSAFDEEITYNVLEEKINLDTLETEKYLHKDHKNEICLTNSELLMLYVEFSKQAIIKFKKNYDKQSNKE